ncbi:hypothetical protein B5E77_07510 [Lachnoclostridium sp. An131]|jgi:L-amino acid N-acyltransferase YncA|uniref:GNAT family N-acetyltransferase n=1 Tax=Lachnoclostridium sp. An131 TaxID=1965555 RepID=UPI000B37112E|nr:GNAT family N-acetyltransferase [Lachnoclostridium sp. An131]OUQ27375.1 hypothetical protein B5E77_07510 [Lachnoclostridium sp. An131]
MNDLIIREASPSDASRLLAIYRPYVTDTTITFEYEVPSLNEFTSRMEKIRKRYPYLVCEEDGQIIGYAYADTYMIRPAYDWCAEVSIYVDREKRGMGVGKKLYESLFARLREMHVLNLYAVITSENEKSLAFHEKLGFQNFAVFEKAGYKQGRWLDVTWMQLFLGEHKEHPEKVIWAEEMNV